MVAAGVAGQIQIQSLDFSDIALSSHRCHAVGFIDDTLRCAHLGVEKARRDDVDTGELAPFSGKRFAQVGHGSLCRIVDLRENVRILEARCHEGTVAYWLVDWYIDNVC